MSKVMWEVRGWLYVTLQILSTKLANPVVRDVHNECMVSGLAEYKKKHGI